MLESEGNSQLTSHLHWPEVKREQGDDQDETRCEVLADPVAEQIWDDGKHSEEQVEEGGEGVSEIRCTGFTDGEEPKKCKEKAGSVDFHVQAVNT